VSKVRGVHGGALKWRCARRQRGEGHAEIEEVLAEFFGVSRKSVEWRAG